MRVHCLQQSNLASSLLRDSGIRKKASSPMVITMKGIFKGLKIIAKIFTVHKEHEIEIGYPTDVRHVSHIGLGASDSCPSWMNQFRGLDDASAGSVGSTVQSRQTSCSWTSLDFEQPIGGVLLPAEVYTDSSGHDADRTGIPSGPRKTRRKMKSRELWSSSSARSSSLRSTTSFATAYQDFGVLQSALQIVA